MTIGLPLNILILLVAIRFRKSQPSSSWECWVTENFGNHTFGVNDPNVTVTYQYIMCRSIHTQYWMDQNQKVSDRAPRGRQLDG